MDKLCNNKYSRRLRRKCRGNHIKTLNRCRALLTALSMVLLLGCSGIESRPATFVQLAIGTKPSSFVVANDVSVSIPGGRSTELREGSVWESVGKLPEGVVYRSRGTDLVLEDSDFSTQHEAYIVVDQRSLIGFYLPAEDRYVGVKHVHPLPIQ